MGFPSASGRTRRTSSTGPLMRGTKGPPAPPADLAICRASSSPRFSSPTTHPACQPQHWSTPTPAPQAPTPPAQLSLYRGLFDGTCCTRPQHGVIARSSCIVSALRAASTAHAPPALALLCCPHHLPPLPPPSLLLHNFWEHCIYVLVCEKLEALSTSSSVMMVYWLFSRRAWQALRGTKPGRWPAAMPGPSLCALCLQAT
mmetsp:Transcript_12822/g.22104  ORF Transcript_12822/g.22104 Transcript_12822/m.22104 type:complete len:201 (-) Transcript_12822:141-743(-)